MSMSSVDEAIECGDAGGKKMFGRLHAALLVREERTFKVDAEGTGASRLGQLRDFVGRPSRARSVASSGAATVVAR